MIDYKYWKNSQELNIRKNDIINIDLKHRTPITAGTLPFGLILKEGILNGITKEEGIFYFLSDKKYKIIVK